MIDLLDNVPLWIGRSLVIAVVFVIGLLIVQFPFVGPWLPPTVGVVVLAGTGWSTERGIRAVLAFRDEKMKVERRRSRILASQEAQSIQISEQNARNPW